MIINNSYHYLKSYFTFRKNPLPKTTEKGLKYRFDDQLVAGSDEVISIIEQPPQKRTILTDLVINPIFSTRIPRQDFLQFPYTVFIIRSIKISKDVFYFDRLSVGFSPRSVTSATDYLWKLPLGNYYTNNKFGMCLTGLCMNAKASHKELDNYVISNFWQSKFEFSYFKSSVLDNWDCNSSLYYPRPIYNIAKIDKKTLFHSTEE
jgi:hypothetical protein